MSKGIKNYYLCITYDTKPIDDSSKFKEIITKFFGESLAKEPKELDQ